MVLETEVAEICKSLKWSEADAEAKIHEIEQEDYLANFPEAQRRLQAIKVFRAEAAQLLASSAEDYNLYVLASSPAETGTKKDKTPFYIPGRVLAVGKSEDGPFGLINIAFFEDHADKQSKFVVGTHVDTRLTLSNDINPQRPVYQCSVDGSFTLKDAEQEVELPDDLGAFLRNIIHHVPVAELEDAKHHSPAYELRLVIGQVAFGNLRKTKIGPMATLQVFDDSVGLEKDAKRMQVRVPVTEFKYGTGSEIIAIGPLKKQVVKKDDEIKEYITLNANFVFATPGGLHVPRAAPPVQAGSKPADVLEEDEEVDVADFN